MVKGYTNLAYLKYYTKTKNIINISVYMCIMFDIWYIQNTVLNRYMPAI